MVLKSRKASLLLVIFAASICLSLAGCFSDPIQDDLINYLNVQSPPLLKEEQRINQDFEKVAGENYTDDATMYAKLTDDVIPDLKKLISDLEALKLQTTEVRNVHQKWIDAAKMRLKAYETLKKALEDQSSAGVDQANKYFDDTATMYVQHETAIEDLAKAHNVELTRN